MSQARSACNIRKDFPVPIDLPFGSTQDFPPLLVPLHFQSVLGAIAWSTLSSCPSYQSVRSNLTQQSVNWHINKQYPFWSKSDRFSNKQGDFLSAPPLNLQRSPRNRNHCIYISISHACTASKSSKTSASLGQNLASNLGQNVSQPNLSFKVSSQTSVSSISRCQRFNHPGQLLIHPFQLFNHFISMKLSSQYDQ